MKLSIKWSIIGFFIPIVGIIVGKRIMISNEALGRSLRRGSAFSTMVVILVGAILLVYFASKGLGF